MNLSSQKTKLIDTNGTAQGTLMEDGSITVRSYLQAIAEGDVANHSSWTKIGYNGALGATEEDLWPVGGTYVFPTTAMQMEVVSSSADDDGSPAGTGVRTIRLFYLTSDFTEATEDITLNGTTPVATTATNIYRVNHMRTLTCGSLGTAAGDIDIRHIDNTPIYGRIATGYNRMRQFIYTVPKNKQLWIFNIFFSCGSNVAGRQVRFDTKGTYDNLTGSLNTFFQTYSEVITQDNAIDIPIEMATKFPTGTDLKVSAISPDGATAASIIIRGWLETA